VVIFHSKFFASLSIFPLSLFSFPAMDDFRVTGTAKGFGHAPPEWPFRSPFAPMCFTFARKRITFDAP